MSAHRSVRQHRRHRITAVVTGVLTCVALAACGSSGGSPAAQTTLPPATGDGSTAAATSTSSELSGTPQASGCDTAPAEAVAAALKKYPEVTSVEVNGGCHEISIRTSMAPADPLTPTSSKAVAICRAAAKMAYTQRDISGIYVAWSDGHEASAGLKTSDCIPG